MGDLGVSKYIRDCPKVFHKLDELSESFRNIQKPLYRQYFECAVQQLFIDIVNSMGIKIKIPSPASDSVALNKERKQFYTRIIETYIGDLSHDKITLPQLASQLQLSDGQTRRLIKQIYNVDFSGLFAATRVTMAKTMLLETDLPIEEIAAQVGYSYVGFLRVFKRITGKTPTEFRKNAGSSAIGR